MSQTKLSKQQAINELWSRGVLFYKLDAVQKELYNSFYTDNHKTRVWLMARRSGKSFLLLVLAIEQCLRSKNSIVKYVAQSKLQVNNIIRPIMRKILEDCPTELQPDYNSKDYTYYFKNGSEIQMSGTDNGHAEKLRGGDSHIFIVDEAGSCDDLKNIIKSILLPTTLTTRGKGILAGTPPKDSEHEFLEFLEQAELRGTLTKKTIFDNKRITKEQLDELIAEVGGLHTEEARRELLCEIIRDSTTSVIPEFTEDLAKKITKDWPKPPHYDAYEGMDLGGRDLTVVLFGYYDFRADKIIIEDEIVMDFREHDSNIKTLTKRILEKESILWTNILTNEQVQPTRYSDINYIVTNEIRQYSHNKINFLTTKKDEKIAALNNLRSLLISEKIIINPKCTTLLRHLKNVKWEKTRTLFARSADDGHYDAVDALLYLVRNVNTKKNPYPAGYSMNLRKEDAFVLNKDRYGSNDQLSIYKKLFNFKR